MLSKWSWIIFNLIIYASTTTLLEAKTKVFLELIELDYEDVCRNISDVQWSFIVSPTNETLYAWEMQQYKYAEFKKNRKADVLNGTLDKIRLKPLLQYKCNVIERAGDALLKEEDWKKFIHFAGTVELQRSTISHIDKSQNYSRKDVEYSMSHSGELADKKTAWSTWYRQLKPLVSNYSNNLLLIAQATKENGAKNVEEYWEMLSGYPDGYEKLESDWSRINNLYKKILKFVGTNLSRKYGITIINDTFPAHLFGSLQGYDWTDLSSDALPYSDLIYNIKKNLWKKRYIGKSLYKVASNMGLSLFKQVPQAEFWDESEFNRQCPSTLLNFCQDGKMRVSTCSKATLSNFLTAHRDVGKILFNQMTIETTPVLNIVNRYSGLEEGISTLFGILSTSPAWLNHTYLMNATSDNEQRMIVSLMITALNTLPQLAYYYAADMWRINAIKENITDPADLVSSWWKYRREYEGISSADTDSPTFLDDSYIISNKPYLPKILGTILAFQLYEYTLDSTEVRYSSIDGKLMHNIIKMIQQGGSYNWQYILNKYLEIDDISVYALASYFTPLEEFIEEHEEDFEYKSGLAEDKELDELEKHVLQEINAPTTTTTAATTTTRVRTKGAQKATSNPNQVRSKTGKPLETKSSVYTLNDKPKSSGPSGLNLSTEVPTDKSLTPDTADDAESDKPKISTSKTVWVISAILIAIVIICIIAIFGKRRCRKTPKNRRYV